MSLFPQILRSTQSQPRFLSDIQPTGPQLAYDKQKNEEDQMQDLVYGHVSAAAFARRTAFAMVVAASIGWAAKASAQDATSLYLEISQGTDQSTTVGAVFSVPFSVRASDAHGIPYSGLLIYFSNDVCGGWDAGPNGCPYSGVFGFFTSGNTYAEAITDETGVAIAPPYIAGLGAGNIGVYAYAPPLEPPYYLSYTVAMRVDVVFALNQTPCEVEPVDCPREVIFRDAFEGNAD